MTILRNAFEKHLILQRYSPKTNEAYLHAVKGLAYFFNQSPDKLTDEQIQDYLRYLIEDRKYAWSTCNVTFCGIKCFYDNVLHRSTELMIPPRPRQKRLPTILSQNEVSKLLNTCTNLKHKALLLTVYSAGLRVSEVVSLQAVHIERSRRMIRVEQGKGKKDRYTILSGKLLVELENYWREYHPGDWLFFGKDKKKHMPVSTAQQIYYTAKRRAGITKGRGIHTLRHCFATHLMEQGVQPYVIKRMMGHKALATTAGYIHVSNQFLSTVKSPLDNLEGNQQKRLQ
jgi:site-specific recombinase XerD